MEVPEDFVLPSKYVTIHLEALNPSCRRHLAMHLNLEGTVNEDFKINNYLGLAEKVGFSYLEIRNFELQKSPTEQLLADWTATPQMLPTVGALWQYLRDLERYDVLTDIWKSLKQDCDRYIEIKSRFPKKPEPIQDTTISQSTEQSDHDADEGAIMTVDDALHGTQTMFDAFICYNPEGKDLEFVREMIEILENKNGLKLFVPWRDDLPGASHNTVCAKLIEHRCKRMIIVLSPRYLSSSACDFQTKFAHGLSPGSKKKKLIPVLIEDCNIPEILRHVTCCNYTKKDLIEWFWKRLISSLKAPLNPSECRSSNRNQLNAISLDTSVEVSGWSSTGSSGASSMGASSLTSSSSSAGYSMSSSGSSSTRSGSSVPRTNADYHQVQPSFPPYLELLSNSPPLPRRANDYERISNVRPIQNANTNDSAESGERPSHNYTQPVMATSANTETKQKSKHGTDNTSSRNMSPTIKGRPVPPIPKEESQKSNTDSKTSDKKEIFC